jgi:hypothetical protein
VKQPLELARRAIRCDFIEHDEIPGFHVGDPADELAQPGCIISAGRVTRGVVESPGCEEGYDPGVPEFGLALTIYDDAVVPECALTEYRLRSTGELVVTGIGYQPFARAVEDEIVLVEMVVPHLAVAALERQQGIIATPTASQCSPSDVGEQR